MLEDDDGTKTETIVISEHYQPANIAHHIFSRWLQGGGKEPVTWVTLIAVLKQVGFIRLARSIKELSVSPREDIHHSIPTENGNLIVSCRDPNPLITWKRGVVTIGTLLYLWVEQFGIYDTMYTTEPH